MRSKYVQCVHSLTHSDMMTQINALMDDDMRYDLVSVHHVDDGDWLAYLQHEPE